MGRNSERVYRKLQHLEELSKRLRKDMKCEITLDLFSIPLCEQAQDFLNLLTAEDMAMKWTDAPSSREDEPNPKDCD